jgi:hypothetical protein
MSKKSKKRSGKKAGETAARPEPSRPGRPPLYVMAALAACALLAASFAATRFEPVRRAVGMRPLSAASAAQATPTPLPLSKEYIYAGGRLVATEESAAAATPTPSGPAPTNFEARFVTAAQGGPGVKLTWSSPSPAVTGYKVERRSGLGEGAFTVIPVNDNVETYTDPMGETNTSYIYRVSAVYGGGTSAYSPYDLATAVAFSDDPLQSKVTTIRAAHLTELRRAVKAVRTLAGKGDPVWTYPDPVSYPATARRAIYLSDVTEMRLQLDEALTRLDEALGVQLFLKPYPANPALAEHGPVYADHFNQIRDRVR